LPETPVPTKISRLFLVSDILHNSALPRASNFRTGFRETLPQIFESLNEKYRSITGRITAENLKESVLSVLRAWEKWSLWQQSIIDGFFATFLRSEADDKKKRKEQMRILTVLLWKILMGCPWKKIGPAAGLSGNKKEQRPNGKKMILHKDQLPHPHLRRPSQGRKIRQQLISG